MKLGVLTVPFSDMSFEESAKYLSSLGVEAVELGTGGFTSDCHSRLSELLNNYGKVTEMKKILEYYGMRISAFSCHGNPVHPVREIAQNANRVYEDTLKLAELMEIDTVVTFSGCPGGDSTSQKPNWVTCPWPGEFHDILEYQWSECLLPYWENASAKARDSGVKVAIEMHPGFCVYNAETMLKLRNETGIEIGANFDPSHLFWQGIDAVTAIYELGDAIHYVHAKDCRVDDRNVRRNGVLDTKHYSRIQERSWVFRTVGYGHGEVVWRDIISALKTVGYDKTVSIEHEDALMSINEGIEKAVAFLKSIMIQEQNKEIWWA